MKRWLLPIVLALAGCVSTTTRGGGGGGYTGVTVGGGPAVAYDTQIVMPNLVGKTFDEAVKICKAAGFVLPPEFGRPPDCDDSAPKVDGKIRCQDPEAGAKVGAHALIELSIYKAPVRTNITADEGESLIGKTPDVAKKMLAGWGFRGKIRIQSSGTGNRRCSAGQICEIMPSAPFGLDEDISFGVADELKITAPPP